MKIKKVAQAVAQDYSVNGAYNTSQSQAYSCAYVNTITPTNNYGTSSVNGYTQAYVNGLNTYPTTEQRIGTWIDGKPIYRLVTNCTLGSTAGSQFTYMNTPAEVDTMVNVYGMLTEQSARMSINSYYSSSYYCCAYYNPDKTIRGICGSSIVGRKCFVVLEYTKTTD